MWLQLLLLACERVNAASANHAALNSAARILPERIAPSSDSCQLLSAKPHDTSGLCICSSGAWIFGDKLTHCTRMTWPQLLSVVFKGLAPCRITVCPPAKWLSSTAGLLSMSVSCMDRISQLACMQLGVRHAETLGQRVSQQELQGRCSQPSDSSGPMTSGSAAGGG